MDLWVRMPEIQKFVREHTEIGKKYKFFDEIQAKYKRMRLIAYYPHFALFVDKYGLKESYTYPELYEWIRQQSQGENGIFVNQLGEIISESDVVDMIRNTNLYYYEIAKKLHADRTMIAQIAATHGIKRGQGTKKKKQENANQKLEKWLREGK